MRLIDTTPTPEFRMADFARFIVAAEPALPWAPGSFISAYQLSRLEVNTALADGDSVASAIRDFMANQTAWSGLVSELHDQLTALTMNRPGRPTDWPANPRWFSGRLRRAAPILRSIGIECQDHRTARGTEVELTRIAPPATSAPPIAFGQEMTGDGANGASVATDIDSRPLRMRFPGMGRIFR